VPISVRSLDVVLTATCNLRCAYCYQNRHGPLHMDWGTLKAAVDLLLASDRRRVKLNFLGGEPLIRFSTIRRAVAHAERHLPPDKRIQYGISTNGLLLDEEVTGFLDAHGFEVQLSFDGVERAQDLRAGDSFSRLDALVDRLRRRHPALYRDRLSVAITLTTANLPHLADSVDYFLAKGVHSIDVAPCLSDEAVPHHGMMKELGRQLSRIHRSLLDHYTRTGEVPLKLFRKKRGERPALNPGGAICRAGTAEAVTVDVSGRVHGCVLLCDSYQSPSTGLLRDAIAATSPGDLRRAAFPARLADYPGRARETRLFHDRRRKHSALGRCRDCRHVESCGVCPLSAAYLPGNDDPDRIPAFACAFMKVALDYRARFPDQPDAYELLTGQARTPDLIRELLEIADDGSVA